ncbi:MAG: ArsA family ATPase [Micrococcus sp.]|nr:ArsA family ATPase [Micrococcus sp.]
MRPPSPALLELLGQRRVLFFGGKGGVGKTTLASATALALARQGRRVLVVSTDPAHNLGHLWDTRVGTTTTPLFSDAGSGGAVLGMEIDADAVAAEHLRTVEATVRAMMPEHLHGEVRRYFRLAEASPGTHEAALLEKMCTVVVQALAEVDVLIFDTAPTGHTARLLALPELMSTWTDGLLRRREQSERFADAITGLTRPRDDCDATTRAVLGDGPPTPRRAGGSASQRRDADIRHLLERRKHLFERMRAVVTDPGTTTFVIVLIGERMPVLESQALYGQLEDAGVDVGALVVNRRSPADAGEVLAERAALEAEQVAALRGLIPRVPVVQVPQTRGGLSGAAQLGAVADLLAGR